MFEMFWTITMLICAVGNALFMFNWFMEERWGMFFVAFGGLTAAILALTL